MMVSEAEMTPPTGRSQQKRAAILEAAREVFLEKGYDRASMDEIAARATVSKQTIYKNFVDKERLFTEIIVSDIRRAERSTQDLVDALGESQDIEDDLRVFARRHIRDVVQPDIMRMRRIVISVADRFPDLAGAWYESGPERGHAVLADHLRRLSQRGLLHIADPSLAAQHLNWLILSIPLNLAMFRPMGETFDDSQLDYYADEAIRAFLATYRAAPGEGRGASPY